jgi:hypothetical protein
MTSVETIVGVDFAGPAREQDQRKKIVAIRAQVEGWNRYRIVLDDFSQRLLLDSPGWTLKDLAKELVIQNEIGEVGRTAPAYTRRDGQVRQQIEVSRGIP